MRTMRYFLTAGLMAAFALPAVAYAQPVGPALGDPAPPPPPAPAAQKSDEKKSGIAETLGGAVGGVLGSTAGAVGGPLGSAAAGMVGKRVGSGAVSMVKKVTGGDGDDDIRAPDRIAQPDLPPPIPAAEVAAADASVRTLDPVKLAPPAPAVQAIQIAPPPPVPEPVSTPVLEPSPPSSAASPGG